MAGGRDSLINMYILSIYMNPEAVTKLVKRYGNSGGVYLPSSWIGGRVEVSLVNRPPNPEKDLPLALAGSMEHIVSILLYGSYAAGEPGPGSDIDVIVVTDNHIKGMGVPEGLGGMNYDIRIMRADEIRRLAGRDILLSKSLEAAKAVLNGSFLEELRSIKPKGSPMERISLAKSSLNIIKGLFEPGGDNTELAYPLMMRIKEMLLMECALSGRKYSLSLLEGRILARGISQSEYGKLMAYYRAVRAGSKPVKPGPGSSTLEKLLGLLEEMVRNAEKKQAAKKGD
jgi:predicted nucleotidyltransferase